MGFDPQEKSFTATGEIPTTLGYDSHAAQVIGRKHLGIEARRLASPTYGLHFEPGANVFHGQHANRLGPEIALQYVSRSRGHERDHPVVMAQIITEVDSKRGQFSWTHIQLNQSREVQDVSVHLAIILT
jgi:hypothetical protein